MLDMKSDIAGQTEWADLMTPATLAWYRNGSEGEGLTWALNIQNAYATSNVSAFLYWIGAGNTTTNSALILLHKDAVKVSKRLWAFAQFSRFVKPGAIRIDTSANVANHTKLSSSGFRNPDGSVAIQVINNGSSVGFVSIRGIDLTGRGTRTYLTNNEYDLARLSILATDENDCSVVPARSMVSFLYSRKIAPR
jgi:O-glycosyl hydrolase